jgi:hypothetical protein
LQYPVSMVAVLGHLVLSPRHNNKMPDRRSDIAFYRYRTATSHRERESRISFSRSDVLKCHFVVMVFCRLAEKCVEGTIELSFSLVIFAILFIYMFSLCCNCIVSSNKRKCM